jgi:hypothetical protein
MSESTGKRVALRAQEISRGIAFQRLPTPEVLEKMSAEERHAAQEDLRVELFAVSAILADATVGRARREREAFPPYGLVLSRHTELRMIVSNPEPVAAGAVDSFLALGKAYVDTTVYHLHAALGEVRGEGRGWLEERLEKLLELFRVGASQASRARMRDGVSFLYGGLHFGTAVCVQLAEVMASMLESDPSLTAADKAAIMTRSSKPAFDLADFSVSGVVQTYQRLQSATRRSVVGKSSQGWLDPDRFTIREADGRPWRIDLKEEGLPSPDESPGSGADALHSFTTLGCPARISPVGGASPIAALWTWCVELALQTGLLGDPGPGATQPGGDLAAPPGEPVAPTGDPPTADAAVEPAPPEGDPTASSSASEGDPGARSAGRAADPAPPEGDPAAGPNPPG